MNFKLKSPHSNNESLIIFYSNLKNSQRFVYSTGERISPKLWDTLNQYPIKTKIRIDLLKCNAANLLGLNALLSPSKSFSIDIEAGELTF